MLMVSFKLWDSQSTDVKAIERGLPLGMNTKSPLLNSIYDSQIFSSYLLFLILGNSF